MFWSWVTRFTLGDNFEASERFSRRFPHDATLGTAIIGLPIPDWRRVTDRFVLTQTGGNDPEWTPRPAHRMRAGSLFFRSVCGGLPAYVPAEVLERSVVARSAGDRHEPSARWGAQLAVLASAELPTLPYKVCDQLVDLFVPAVVHEIPHVDAITGGSVFGPAKSRHEAEPNSGKAGGLLSRSLNHWRASQGNRRWHGARGPLRPIGRHTVRARKTA